MLRRLAPTAVLALLLAGCSGDGGGEAKDTPIRIGSKNFTEGHDADRRLRGGGG